MAYAYKRLFEESGGKYYITSNCPSIVEMIEKYHPHLVPNLAPLVSPVIASAMVTRDLYGDDVANVFIGPCIDIKEEARLYGENNLVEAVLTFIEIRQLFEEKEIQEKTVRCLNLIPLSETGEPFTPTLPGYCRLAGIKRDLVIKPRDNRLGSEDVREAIKDFDHHN